MDTNLPRQNNSDSVLHFSPAEVHGLDCVPDAAMLGLAAQLMIGTSRHGNGDINRCLESTVRARQGHVQPRPTDCQQTRHGDHGSDAGFVGTRLETYTVFTSCVQSTAVKGELTDTECNGRQVDSHDDFTGR